MSNNKVDCCGYKAEGGKGDEEQLRGVTGVGDGTARAQGLVAPGPLRRRRSAEADLQEGVIVSDCSQYAGELDRNEVDVNYRQVNTHYGNRKTINEVTFDRKQQSNWKQENVTFIKRQRILVLDRTFHYFQCPKHFI